MASTRCGLIGKRLGHSFSRLLHPWFCGEYSFELFEVSPGALEDFVKKGDFMGLNVTMPYKKTVMAYCSALSPAAEAIGSVNTLVYKKGGIYGANTDYPGFLYMARRAGITLAGKNVLLLGTGGAAAAVEYACATEGAARLVKVSRSGPVDYSNIPDKACWQVIVNATPVGMYPDNYTSPISLEGFSGLEGVLDVVYNPMRTRLVMQAEALGLKAAGGMAMLTAQAKYASELFTGNEISDERLDEVYTGFMRRQENIVLIGMPGCGKSEVGAALAKRLGRTFVDTDAEVAEAAGMSVPEIFRFKGEAYFRKLEETAVKEAGCRLGAVIATGGGAPLYGENVMALRQNGRLYLINRPLEQLATDGRPLSRELSAMYDKRMPVYARCADAAVRNDSDIQSAVKRITDEFFGDAE